MHSSFLKRQCFKLGPVCFTPLPAKVTSLAATAKQPALEAFLEAMKPPQGEALATWHFSWLGRGYSMGESWDRR